MGHREGGRCTPAAQAALLRDVVGNPWRPAALPQGPPAKCERCEGDGWNPSDDGWGARDKCKVCDGKGTLPLFGPCPWLTPQVLTLAAAAYQERPGRRCEACGGRPDRGTTEAGTRLLCLDCRGVGRIDDGSLDPFRLALVADALEEAGCDEASILDHLRSPGPHVRGCWALDLLLGKE